MASCSLRRASDRSAAATQRADTVRRGIVLQRVHNTVAALEFLAARDVAPAIIRRVLGGDKLRREDRAAVAALPWRPGHDR